MNNPTKEKSKNKSFLSKLFDPLRTSIAGFFGYGKNQIRDQQTNITPSKLAMKNINSTINTNRIEYSGDSFRFSRDYKLNLDNELYSRVEDSYSTDNIKQSKNFFLIPPFEIKKTSVTEFISNIKYEIINEKRFLPNEIQLVKCMANEDNEGIVNKYGLHNSKMSLITTIDPMLKLYSDSLNKNIIIKEIQSDIKFNNEFNLNQNSSQRTISISKNDKVDRRRSYAKHQASLINSNSKYEEGLDASYTRNSNRAKDSEIARLKRQNAFLKGNSKKTSNYNSPYTNRISSCTTSPNVSQQSKDNIKESTKQSNPQVKDNTNVIPEEEDENEAKSLMMTNNFTSNLSKSKVTNNVGGKQNILGIGRNLCNDFENLSKSNNLVKPVDLKSNNSNLIEVKAETIKFNSDNKNENDLDKEEINSDNTKLKKFEEFRNKSVKKFKVEFSRITNEQELTILSQKNESSQKEENYKEEATNTDDFKNSSKCREMFLKKEDEGVSSMMKLENKTVNSTELPIPFSFLPKEIKNEEEVKTTKSSVNQTFEAKTELTSSITNDLNVIKQDKNKAMTEEETQITPTIETEKYNTQDNIPETQYMVQDDAQPHTANNNMANLNPISNIENITNAGTDNSKNSSLLTENNPFLAANKNIEGVNKFNAVPTQTVTKIPTTLMIVPSGNSFNNFGNANNQNSSPKSVSSAFSFNHSNQHNVGSTSSFNSLQNKPFPFNPMSHLNKIEERPEGKMSVERDMMPSGRLGYYNTANIQSNFPSQTFNLNNNVSQPSNMNQSFPIHPPNNSIQSNPFVSNNNVSNYSSFNHPQTFPSNNLNLLQPSSIIDSNQNKHFPVNNQSQFNTTNNNTNAFFNVNKNQHVINDNPFSKTPNDPVQINSNPFLSNINKTQQSSTGLGILNDNEPKRKITRGYK